MHITVYTWLRLVYNRTIRTMETNRKKKIMNMNDIASASEYLRDQLALTEAANELDPNIHPELIRMWTDQMINTNSDIEIESVISALDELVAEYDSVGAAIEEAIENLNDYA